MADQLEREGFCQQIADLKFALRRALDERDLLAVKVSQWKHLKSPLTAQELAAVECVVGVYQEWAEEYCVSHQNDVQGIVATLQGLLNRTK
jgi:hypothetical protein